MSCIARALLVGATLSLLLAVVLSVNPAPADAKLQLRFSSKEKACLPEAGKVARRLKTRAARLKRQARRFSRAARRHRALRHPRLSHKRTRQARRALRAARQAKRTSGVCLRAARKHRTPRPVSVGTEQLGPAGFRVGLATTYARNLTEVAWTTHVGAKLARHEFEHAPVAWDDSFYREATLRGVTILPLINTTTVPATEAARQSFAELVRSHVARFGPGGSFWRDNPDLDASFAPRVFEVMNEPYIQWQGGPYNPAAYAQLVKRTAELVRPVNPNVKLTLAAATTYYGTQNNGADWINSLYAAVPNLNDYFDLVAVHPYGHNPDTCDPAARWCFRQVEEIRERFNAHGASAKRFWITEVGNHTGGPSAHTEAEQATYLTRYVAMAKSYGYVDALLYFAYKDHCSDTGNKECFYGVLRSDGSAKPAFAALRESALANP